MGMIIRRGLWILAVVVVLFVLDHWLLRLEDRGWINYRKRGLSRGGAAYHALTMHSIFNPSAENLSKARYEEVVERDESGDPPPFHDPDDDLPPLTGVEPPHDDPGTGGSGSNQTGT